MGRFVDDDFLGKIGEMAVLQELNDGHIKSTYTDDKGWETRLIYHVDKPIQGKHEGIVAYLQDRGCDFVQMEIEYQKDKDTPETRPTGRKRITFHEVKAQPGTFGVYRKAKSEALQVIEHLRSDDKSGIVAGTGNVIVEVYASKKGIRQHNPKLLEHIAKSNPFATPEAGWYWKYKYFFENELPADTAEVEYRHMVWFYLLQAEERPCDEDGYELAENRPAFLISVTMDRLIEVVEETLKKGNPKQWKKGKDKTPILAIPMFEMVPDGIKNPNLSWFVTEDPSSSLLQIIAEQYGKSAEEFKYEDQDTGKADYRIPLQNFIDAIVTDEGQISVKPYPQLGTRQEEELKGEGKVYEFYGYKFLISEAINVGNNSTNDETNLRHLTGIMKKYGIIQK